MPHAHASVWARARNPGPVRGPAFSETQMAPRCPRRPSKQGPCGPAPASRKQQARQSPPAFRQLSPVPTAHVRKLRWMNHTRCYLLAQDPAPNAQTPRVRGGGCGSGRCFLPRPNALGGACRPEGPVSPGSSGLLQARCWAGGGGRVGALALLGRLPLCWACAPPAGHGPRSEMEARRRGWLACTSVAWPLTTLLWALNCGVSPWPPLWEAGVGTVWPPPLQQLAP